MAIEQILVVDDEPLMREFLETTLKRNSYDVLTCPNGMDAIKELQKRNFDLVLTDMKMPGIGGIEVLEEVKRVSPETEVIVMTAYGTVETAVEAMKKGAYDYIMKPFTPDQIEHLIKMAEERRSLINENKYLRSMLQNHYEIQDIVGVDPKTNSVKETIIKVADSKASVLIYGETGTGKELVASAIHYSSPRKNKVFIRVNCASLSETLLESELFGHEKGSFTGALQKREGRFELANGGTLLLDEISEISPKLQTKLLRVLQEREFERVGGTRTIKVDVRIIATTNRELEREIKKGGFREDLYYRLNVLPIYLYPLRERKDDIPVLVDFFLKKYSHENSRKSRLCSPSAMKALKEYSWPGNVRELQNVVERACVMTQNEQIDIDDISLFSTNIEKTTEDNHIEEVKTLYEQEKTAIFRALEFCSGNKSKAAQMLGVSSRTLRNKLQEYNS